MTEEEKKEFWKDAETFHFECWASPAIYKATIVAVLQKEFPGETAGITGDIAKAITEKLYDRFG